VDAGAVDGEPSSTEKGSPHVEVCALERPRREMRLVRRRDLDFIVASNWHVRNGSRPVRCSAVWTNGNAMRLIDVKLLRAEISLMLFAY
jgi:hypothetical protein